MHAVIQTKELEAKIGAPFEHEKPRQELTLRQGEIEDKLDVTTNQAPSQVEADSTDGNEQKI